MNRIFIALEVPGTVKYKLVDLRKKMLPISGLKWESLKKLHVTLKFIGPCTDNQIVSIHKKLITVLSKFSAIQCCINHVGFFPNQHKPRIFWAGLEESKILNEMVTKIDVSLSSIGFVTEKRKIHPHITLLRIRRELNAGTIHKAVHQHFEHLNFVANMVTLYKSELLPEKSVYSKIKQYNLL
ncbi:MAG: RNA 2',3'-cyclic phosphodiesterase [Melioribacteraceae bacterium]|nr:RNA 2',3'-cyclic phosphodiesterase [Melioribacteraceae bacterium]